MSVQQPRRRLLVITYHFPPDGAVGGLRWSGISKNLVSRGWEVDVVTAATSDDSASVPGVTVHRRPRWRTLNDLYSARAQRLRGTPPESAAPGASASDAANRGRVRRWDRVRHDLGALLAFPDFGRGWIWRAAFTTRRLMHARGIDLVVSSGPPHSAHVAAAIACFGTRVPYVIDMRDPWVSMLDVPRVQTISESRWVRALLEGLERLARRRARHVVTNTPEFLTQLQQAYPGTPATCIPNGIDLARVPPPTSKFEGLSIAYAGTLYLNRDLTPVVRALAQFRRCHPEAAGVTRLRVAGDMDQAHRARFWQEVDAAGLHDAVDVLGRVSGEEALDLVNRSHLAVVLAQHQPTQVPAKIYECVAMQVPTLVIAEATSAAAREARRIGATTCEPEDIDGICGLLEELSAGTQRAAPSTASVSYEAIAADLDALLRRLLA